MLVICGGGGIRYRPCGGRVPAQLTCPSAQAQLMAGLGSAPGTKYRRSANHVQNKVQKFNVKCEPSDSPRSSGAARNAAIRGGQDKLLCKAAAPAIWPHCLQTYPRSLSQCQRRRKGISISQSAPLDLELEVRTYRIRAIGKT